jgi:hypothetical protein
LILFARYGIRALPFMTVCSLINFNAKVGSTDFLPATLSLISQGSLALKLNNDQNVINGKARMP